MLACVRKDVRATKCIVGVYSFCEQSSDDETVLNRYQIIESSLCTCKCWLNCAGYMKNLQIREKLSKGHLNENEAVEPEQNWDVFLRSYFFF